MDVAKVNRTDIKKRGKYVRRNKDKGVKLETWSNPINHPEDPQSTTTPPSISFPTIALAESFNPPGLYLTFSHKILEGVEGYIFNTPIFLKDFLETIL